MITKVQERSGIILDIGCGANKHPGSVGMDIRALPGVDVVHDINVHPWPLPDECVITAIASHLVEHIPPVAIGPDGHTWFPFVAFMDEVWRVLKVDGQFAIALPHGYSPGYLQDPTHCNACNEATWAYFDPEHPSMLWTIYKPKPWKIESLNWSLIGNMEVLLRKRGLEDDGQDHNNGTG